MSIYDVNGNVISSGGGGDVKETFLELVADGEINLGSAIGATLAYNGLTDAWITNATTAYNSMLARYTELANGSIPFFISTDQHGFGTNLEQHRWVNNIDADGMNMANINLGDTVQDYFAKSIMTTAIGRTKQIKNYISVVGNHDALWRGNDVPSVHDMTRFFHSTYDREITTGANSSYTVIDRKHAVKYVIVDTYSNVGVTQGNLTNDQLTGDLADWLITELSDDTRDIILLQHWMLYAPARVYTYRNGNPCTDGIGGIQALRGLVTARKNKTSGTVTDKDGVSHSYDFTGCAHELLCALHGHQHEEMYATLDNLLCYVTDWFGNNGSCVFGLVDRASEKLRIWKFDSATTYDELVLDL